MSENCREQIYSEDYLDYLIEYFPVQVKEGNLHEDTSNCYLLASSRFAVFYERGRDYSKGPDSSVRVIPHCYGLLTSEQVLESAGISRVRRQPGLGLFGQGVLVGFVDTGERVIILSSQREAGKY